MRILLQNRETKRYLGPDGRWSESAEAALEFGDLAQARNYGSLHGLSQARVVALAGRGSAGASALIPDSPRSRVSDGAL